MINSAFAWTFTAMLFFPQPAQHLASVQGRVRVAGGAEVVPFASVRLLQAGEEIGKRITGIDGTFQFENVDLGPYTLEVTYPGFDYASVSLTILGSTRAQQLEIELRERTGVERRLVASAYELMVPKNARQEFERGLDERKRSNCKKALNHLERATQIFSKYAAAHNEMGNCYVELQQPSDAEESFKQGIRYGTSVAPYLNLADLYVKQKRFEDASALLDQGIRSFPLEGDLYFALANVRFGEGRLNEAEAAGLAADGRNHRIPDLHLLLAKIYLQQQNEPAVVEQLKLYLKEAPKGAMADKVRESLQRR